MPMNASPHLYLQEACPACQPELAGHHSLTEPTEPQLYREKRPGAHIWLMSLPLLGLELLGRRQEGSLLPAVTPRHWGRS